MINLASCKERTMNACRCNLRLQVQSSFMCELSITALLWANFGHVGVQFWPKKYSSYIGIQYNFNDQNELVATRGATVSLTMQQHRKKCRSQCEYSRDALQVETQQIKKILFVMCVALRFKSYYFPLMFKFIHISIPSQSNSVISTRPPNKLLILGFVRPQSP